MAEGRESSYLSPLEEEFLQDFEANEDIDQQLLSEKEVAAHKLWVAFQDSATAVAHLFKGKTNECYYKVLTPPPFSPDCQQQAGLAAWVPFHESASAVTQLYRGRCLPKKL